MRVEIQLDPDTARALHQGAGPDVRTPRAASAVRRAADDLGVTLMPVDPGQSNSLTAPFFFVDVPDRATAERVASRFQQVPGVAAAWVRPSDQLP